MTKLDSITGKKYALPTEAQWEYAARGGVKSTGYKYSDGDNINDVTWWNANSNFRTARIGTRRPNELGIYDMNGNVSEWCNDYGLGKYFDSSEPLIDPTGPSENWCRIARGGHYSNLAEDCRVSSRRDGISKNPNYRDSGIGFRVVLLPER